MTRINTIPVYKLTDEHLIAEYRELPMVPQALRRSRKSKNGFSIDKIPKEFTLNKGHVTFFYDKLKFLERRYTELVFEMKKRGFNPNVNRPNKLQGLPKEFYNDYLPTTEAKRLITERIKERINQKPEFYHYYGKPLNQAGYEL